MLDSISNYQRMNLIDTSILKYLLSLKDSTKPQQGMRKKFLQERPFPHGCKALEWIKHFSNF
jgi:hypothetical protein